MLETIKSILLSSELLIGILVFVVTYLIGSFPTGYVVVKAHTGEDIRNVGSGSIGATNVKRVLGAKWFFIVLLIDAFKGFLPVFVIANYLQLPHVSVMAVIGAVAVIFGHSKPIYLKFRGGKSVATGVGTILALNWQVGLIIAAIWGTITYVSKYVSLGSIIAIWFTPILMYFFHEPLAYVIYGVIGALYITIKHKDNIVRLINHNENKVR